MNNREKELISKITYLTNNITNYINSNSDWIYYFLNPLAGGNEEIFDCIKEHPDDWKDYIDFEVSNIVSSSIQIKIHIDDYTDCGLVFPRYINLFNFEETVKKNKILCNEKMDEIRKKNIEDDIVRLKDILNKKEEELKNLENDL